MFVSYTYCYYVLGSKQHLETGFILEKESKSKAIKKKKQQSSKFMSIGKNETVSILHGVGRVLNPKGIKPTVYLLLSFIWPEVITIFMHHFLQISDN